MTEPFPLPAGLAAALSRARNLVVLTGAGMSTESGVADVVWFGESLDPAVLGASLAAVKACDLLWVVGTSSLVYPAAQGLPLLAAGLGEGRPVPEPDSRRPGKD